MAALIPSVARSSVAILLLMKEGLKDPEIIQLNKGLAFGACKCLSMCLRVLIFVCDILMPFYEHLLFLDVFVSSGISAVVNGIMFRWDISQHDALHCPLPRLTWAPFKFRCFFRLSTMGSRQLRASNVYISGSLWWETKFARCISPMMCR